MSWQAMEAVQDNSQIESHTGICIMYAIARHADDEGVVGAGGRLTSPSITTLAEKSRVSRRTLLNWIPKLEESGELAVERFGKGRGSWNRYTINLPMPDSIGEDSVHHKDDSIGEDTVQEVKEMVQDLTVLVKGLVQYGEACGSPDTKDTEDTPPNPPQDYDGPRWKLPDEFTEERFLPVWFDWVRHKIDKGKPMTQRQGDYLLDSLADLGESRAIKAIRHSIAAGWENIYEPSQNGSGAKSEYAEEVDDAAGGFNI